MSEISEESKLLCNLKDAGLDENTIQKFLELRGSGKTGEQYRLLSLQRASLLERLHADQYMIDCLDYLVYSMKKEQTKDKK